MSQFDLAVAAAREEVTFWQELVEHLKLPEPGIRKAHEQACKRYEMALQIRQKSKLNEPDPSYPAAAIMTALFQDTSETPIGLDTLDETDAI